MPNSRPKAKTSKKGVNHMKAAFNSTEVYENIRAELQLSQYQAFDDILAFLNPANTTRRFMLLCGSAGTGKTFLSGKIAEYLQNYFCRILMCAPTNKAVKVLKSTQKTLMGVDFMTIHGALGLQEEIDDDGNSVFRNQKPESVKIRDYDYVILDEASMVDDVLFNMILDEIEHVKVKILFVGDKYQIPPVNYPESTVFRTEIQEEYDIKQTELIAIIRQHHDNPIIKLATQIKESLDNARIISELSRKPEFKGLDNIKFYPQNGQILVDVLRRHFLTEDFDLDADYCKVLAWTNEKVDKFNDLIRKLKYGTDAPQLMIGEKLIFDRPWMMHKSMVYSTNEEVTVRSFESEYMDLFDNRFEYYNTVVSKEGEEEICKHHIYILKRECYPAYKAVLKYLTEQAMMYKKGSEEARGWWATKYRFRDNFAAVKYNYAITAHKSQGSTYTHAIVANYDINENPSVVERNRIKYTAVTRPKESVYIIV